MSEREGPRLGADEDFGFAWIFRFGPDGQSSNRGLWRKSKRLNRQEFVVVG